MRVLVTGASGFVGSALVPRLIAAGQEVRCVARTEVSAASVFGAEILRGPELGPGAQWRGVLKGVDAVVHLAARVHVMQEKAVDVLDEFRRVNCAGTEQLARQAAEAGVRRFVYLSSIKVNGERTTRRPFRETDDAKPEDAYAVSKWEAERALARVSEENGLEVVIVRPSLVYGPGVKGNLLSLLRLVRAGVPLPLAGIDNRRSFVGLGNLADLLVAAVMHPGAAGEVFLAADGEDLSTPDLVRRIAWAMRKADRLFRFPPRLLEVASRLAGKSAACERLCDSLTVDASKARAVLGWMPTLSVDEGIDQMVGWFKQERESDITATRNHI